MMQSFKDMAQRAVNGENQFIAYCQDAGFTVDEALKIMSVYRKHRVLKIDIAMGQFNIKHGAFLDKDVMRNALNA